jgi:hypothetical protein
MSTYQINSRPRVGVKNADNHLLRSEDKVMLQKEDVIERLDMLEQVVSQLFSEIVTLRSIVKTLEPVVEPDEEEEDEEEEEELSADELRGAVKNGEIRGFIGKMKGFE